MKRKFHILSALTSMIFLTVFLSFWLYQTYTETKKNLKNQLQISFNETYTSLKESRLNYIFRGNEREITVQGHSEMTPPRIRKIITPDSLNISTPTEDVSFRVFITSQVDTLHSVRLKSIDTTSNFFFTGDSLEITELFGLNPEIIASVDSVWQKKLISANLPAKYHIDVYDSLIGEEGLILRLNEPGLVSSNLYAVAFNQYQGYILGKMTPQIFISLLLLSLVAGSFYLIFKNLFEQEKLGKLKNDFVSNMTHELKTPISTVGVAIEALQNFDALSSPIKTKEYLGIAENELNRLTILVDKVLKMSQFEGAATPLGKVTKTDLMEILHNVSSSMKLQLEKYHGTLDLQVDGEHFAVEGDKVHLANIIYNLLDNALKYGGERPSIRVSLLEKIDAIILKVQDNGLGIPQEYQEKIFDQFFRVPKGNLHNVKGYGLGLSYVSAVVKAHGGKIYLTSEEHLGSEFTIEFPKYD